MHNDFITSIAYHQPTQTVKHVSKVANGLACGCICEECNGKLEAVQPKSNRRWYYRHHATADCKGRYESLLHRYAKQVIVESRSIAREKNHTVTYVNAVSEKSVDPYRPDVTIDLENGEKVYIEVFVSNEVKEIKKDYFITNQMKSFEIDLSGISDKNKLIDIDGLQKEILENYRNRKILYWPKDVNQKENNNSFSPIISGIAFVILAIITFKFLGKRKRRK